jgi:hypothetical protein
MALSAPATRAGPKASAMLLLHSPSPFAAAWHSRRNLGGTAPLLLPTAAALTKSTALDDAFDSFFAEVDKYQHSTVRRPHSSGSSSGGKRARRDAETSMQATTATKPQTTNTTSGADADTSNKHWLPVAEGSWRMSRGLKIPRQKPERRAAALNQASEAATRRRADVSATNKASSADGHPPASPSSTAAHAATSGVARRLFVPTAEWQPVEADHILPAGLQIRATMGAVGATVARIPPS